MESSGSMDGDKGDFTKKITKDFIRAGSEKYDKEKEMEGDQAKGTGEPSLTSGRKSSGEKRGASSLEKGASKTGMRGSLDGIN